MAHAAHDLQFDQFLPHQPQTPALNSLRFLPTKQRYQLGFGFSVHFALLGPRRLGTAKERRIQSLLSKESADPLQRTSAHTTGFDDLGGRPPWTLRAAIDFEQDLCMLSRPRQCLPFAENPLSTLTLGRGQLDAFFLHRGLLFLNFFL